MVSKRRIQTIPEELANSVSHGFGFVAALAAAPVLLLPAFRSGRPLVLVGAVVFSVTMALLYLTSSLYHALPPGRLKSLFNKLDHSAIYLFIAGTYTPFTLGVLRDHGGTTVGILIWSLALLGVTLKTFDRLSHPVLSTGLYLVMGWLILACGGPLVSQLSPAALGWLVAGGVAYTIGVVFYVFTPRIRFSHLAWHLCVMAGTTCHFFAVLWHSG
jgi:hemolysin III